MKKYFVPIVSFLIVILILLQFKKCNNNQLPVTKSDTLIIHDTITLHDTIKSKPILIKSESIKWDTIPKYIPDTNINKLTQQYKDALDSLFVKKTYIKKYNIDTFGTLSIEDTVLKNNLIGQSISYDLKIPKKIIRITTTTTLPYKPTNQLYFGGGLNGDKNFTLNSAELGLLFKSKKDMIYQLKLVQGINGCTNYGVGIYWKIK